MIQAARQPHIRTDSWLFYTTGLCEFSFFAVLGQLEWLNGVLNRLES